jgi:hypothetical protein
VAVLVAAVLDDYFYAWYLFAGGDFAELAAWILALPVEIALVFIGIAFLKWRWRRLGFHCPRCWKFIGLIEPWQCGYCDRKSRVSMIFWPYLSHCRHCGTRPDFLECPHCRQPIVLTHGTDPVAPRLCARLLSAAPVPELTKSDSQIRREAAIKELMIAIEDQKALDACGSQQIAEIETARKREEITEKEARDTITVIRNAVARKKNELQQRRR